MGDCRPARQNGCRRTSIRQASSRSIDAASQPTPHLLRVVVVRRTGTVSVEEPSGRSRPSGTSSTAAGTAPGPRRWAPAAPARDVQREHPDVQRVAREPVGPCRSARGSGCPAAARPVAGEQPQGPAVPAREQQHEDPPERHPPGAELDRVTPDQRDEPAAEQGNPTATGGARAERDHLSGPRASPHHPRAPRRAVSPTRLRCRRERGRL